MLPMRKVLLGFAFLALLHLSHAFPLELIRIVRRWDQNFRCGERAEDHRPQRFVCFVSRSFWHRKAWPQILPLTASSSNLFNFAFQKTFEILLAMTRFPLHPKSQPQPHLARRFVQAVELRHKTQSVFLVHGIVFSGNQTIFLTTTLWYYIY